MAKKSKKFIGVWVDEEVHAKIKRLAENDERSISFTVERFLKAGVKHRVTGGK
jgi:hypothetical protein